jgi:hypothetical protein
MVASAQTLAILACDLEPISWEYAPRFVGPSSHARRGVASDRILAEYRAAKAANGENGK